jgi:hypothetical protein
MGYCFTVNPAVVKKLLAGIFSPGYFARINKLKDRVGNVVVASG